MTYCQCGNRYGSGNTATDCDMVNGDNIGSVNSNAVYKTALKRNTDIVKTFKGEINKGSKAIFIQKDNIIQG